MQELTAQQKELLEKRYLQPGETVDRFYWRIATHPDGDYREALEYHDLISNGKFFPSRMTYMGTGFPFASSCFVLPVEDSLVEIMQTLSEACQVQKYGGGTGYNFSHLRPKGSLISTSGGESSGPVSFMRLYHNAMEVVHRAGKKHAAQMGILNCDHPDIFEFIHCKDTEGAFWTFNISVAVTDEFMTAVREDDLWDLKWGGEVYETVDARKLWDEIVDHAWSNGDPGVIFIDTVNRGNRFIEPIEACNPCGEQFLPPHVSCNLGSLNLSKFVKSGEIDFDELKKATKIAIRFLDKSLDKARWPVKRIEEKTHMYRNIGLGVMGWADMLILMGIPYDSDDAIITSRVVMGFINEWAIEASRELGGYGRRNNTTVTSIAPTGSISFLANCSSGIEPIFGVVTTRNTYVNSYTAVHPLFEKMAKEGGWYSEELVEKIANAGSVQGINEVPDDVKSLFKTAMEIDWTWHVKHQAAFQGYVENAVSKTINMPNSASSHEVGSAFQLAYKLGCKSTTVYRDGSRAVQVLENNKKERDKCPNCDAILFMKDGKQQCVTCGYEPSVGECPNCGSRSYVFAEGCRTCLSCGYGECSI